MADFKTRLSAESAELNDKRTKLELFIESKAFSKIEIEQQALLIIQSGVMKTYLEILIARSSLL